MKFVLASNNKKKLAELGRILSQLGIELTTMAALGLAPIDPVEDADTFEGNAEIKARTICEYTGLPALADDSGLCVDVLFGAPGVYSARYAGEHGCDEDNNDKLLFELADVPAEKRTARFVCCMCCCFPTGEVLHTRGECEGTIAFERSGSDGFGYDPLFLVGNKSFAQMSAQEKDAISHRGRAIEKMCTALKVYLDGSN